MSVVTFLSGEKGYHPGSKEYVDSYVEFYAKRIGKVYNPELSSEGGDKLSVAAKAHLLDDLYKCLDTLDSKASSLLAFCGLVLTSISLFLFTEKPHEYGFVLNVLFVLVSFSSVLTISVINVHWTSPSELRGRSLEAACRSYYTTRRVRTARYHVAWFVTIASVIFLGGYVVFDLAKKIGS